MKAENGQSIVELNKSAIERLNTNKESEALQLLLKAEDLLTESSPADLKLMTYNNFSCLFRKQQKLDKAMLYLFKALEDKNFAAEDMPKVAGTHLNICAVKSSLSQHEEALYHAKRALEILDGVKHTEDLHTSFAVAYYNIGYEYECIGKTELAISSYRGGYEFSKDKLGPVHPLSEKLRDAHLKLSGKYPYARINKFNIKSNNSRTPDKKELNASLPPIKIKETNKHEITTQKRVSYHNNQKKQDSKKDQMFVNSKNKSELKDTIEIGQKKNRLKYQKSIIGNKHLTIKKSRKDVSSLNSRISNDTPDKGSFELNKKLFPADKLRQLKFSPYKKSVLNKEPITSKKLNNIVKGLESLKSRTKALSSSLNAEIEKDYSVKEILVHYKIWAALNKKAKIIFKHYWHRLKTHGMIGHKITLFTKKISSGLLRFYFEHLARTPNQIPSKELEQVTDTTHFETANINS